MVEPDPDRPVGGPIRIRVESGIAGHFTLFEVAPSGDVSRIIPAPDSYIDEYRIEKDRAEVVPDVVITGYEWFDVAPPSGSYLLVAVVSESALGSKNARQCPCGRRPQGFRGQSCGPTPPAGGW